MAWVKIDDRFDEHPKIDELSDAAFRLHLQALCYCARNLTNGDMSWSRATILARRWQEGQELIEELEVAGLWDQTEDGWHVHDYEEYNPSADAVKHRREATRQRVRDWRAQRSRNAVTESVTDSCNAVSNGVGNAVGNASPVPVPVPHTLETPNGISNDAVAARAREVLPDVTDQELTVITDIFEVEPYRQWAGQKTATKIVAGLVRELYTEAGIDVLAEAVHCASYHEEKGLVLRSAAAFANWLKRARYPLTPLHLTPDVRRNVNGNGVTPSREAPPSGAEFYAALTDWLGYLSRHERLPARQVADDSYKQLGFVSFDGAHLTLSKPPSLHPRSAHVWVTTIARVAEHELGREITVTYQEQE